MSSTPPVGEPERQWQQPEFAPGQTPAEAPLEGTVYSASGSVLVPRVAVPPPSVVETVLATVSGLVWPLLILAALFGGIGWWPAILTAIVVSVVTDNVRKHLRQRRRALGSGAASGTNEGEGLR